MIAHALTIIVNELNHQLVEAYGISSNATPAELHDLSSANAQSATREGLNLTLVNIQEDAGLKNSPPGMSHEPLPYRLSIATAAAKPACVAVRDLCILY
ncbi:MULTISPECIES: hypothetical protein [unclassified Methylophilus]|uniref:hypothetical protein n=1 Tax=unclassified Methylophilus TaxID=2630143 RepID=UPI0006FC09F7|nr:MULTISPECIES: hypothetical protein [unclassified Methylophilus]KQT43842.1 hypothetical protein ASG34_03455 [Methylophilus sp. Leaf416]KQT59326.1 hypothetical protein ASG44_03460 [Methylophilus sp. Leaf459]